MAEVAGEDGQRDTALANRQGSASQASPRAGVAAIYDSISELASQAAGRADTGAIDAEVRSAEIGNDTGSGKWIGEVQRLA